MNDNNFNYDIKNILNLSNQILFNIIFNKTINIINLVASFATNKEKQI